MDSSWYIQLHQAPPGASFDDTKETLTWTPTRADIAKTFAWSLEFCDLWGACRAQSWSLTVLAKSAIPTNPNNPTTPTSCQNSQDCPATYKCLQGLCQTQNAKETTLENGQKELGDTHPATPGSNANVTLGCRCQASPRPASNWFTVILLLVGLLLFHRKHS